MTRTSLLRLLLLLVTLGAGCSASTAPAVPVDELLAVPTSAMIDQSEVHATAEIWRDQGLGPVRPTPLGVDIRLTGPASIDVVLIWVILGDEVWSGRAERIDGVGRWLARGGPEWPIGAETTVVVQIRGRRDVARIRVPAVRIGAVVLRSRPPVSSGTRWPAFD